MTSYTDKLCRGEETDLRSFAFRCSNIDGPLPEQAPSDVPWRLERLNEARAKLARVMAWTDEEAEAEYAVATKRATAWVAEVNQERADVQARLDAMAAKVTAWRVPLALERLRRFMLEQIEVSKQPGPMSWEWPDLAGWRQEMLTAADAAVTRAEERLAEAKKEEQANAEYLAALRDALPPENT
jgi:hypothetical protein